MTPCSLDISATLGRVPRASSPILDDTVRSKDSSADEAELSAARTTPNSSAFGLDMNLASTYLEAINCTLES